MTLGQVQCLLVSVLTHGLHNSYLAFVLSGNSLCRRLYELKPSLQNFLQNRAFIHNLLHLLPFALSPLLPSAQKFFLPFFVLKESAKVKLLEIDLACRVVFVTLELVEVCKEQFLLPHCCGLLDDAGARSLARQLLAVCCADLLFELLAGLIHQGCHFYEFLLRLFQDLFRLIVKFYQIRLVWFGRKKLFRILKAFHLFPF